ncbi:hypothetical protein [Sphingomonas morindae]|uniref:Lipoprotein n=1 Tax=Sphingomonas morindae TaxID=1541170 RepID=A0ABY4X5X6_9SPHN|nr:hypothetical protein [Sphingomonas morindae]USI72313.1 hypothetical protein LHA26_13570 [Sphingomonas morindae]
MIRRLVVPALLLLAGCATTPPPGGTAPPPARPPRQHEAGLERVLGRTAAQLVELFGEADLDLHEGGARKLQFVGPACVLDAYLASPHAGAEPVVTYVDARLPDGDDIDRASCVAALSRRAAAK